MHMESVELTHIYIKLNGFNLVLKYFKKYFCIHYAKERKIFHLSNFLTNTIIIIYHTSR